MTMYRNHTGLRLKRARVAITGASSGIGRALSLELARRGSRLILVARNPAGLHETARAVTSIAPASTPVAISADVTDAVDVERLVDRAIDEFAGLDVLINNAGSCVYGSALLMDAADLEEMLAVHLFGPFRAMQTVIPHMIEARKGVIVNVASVAALSGVPYLSVYGAAKAAQISFSQSLRAELAGTGIHILLVYPSNTATPLFEKERKVGGARRPGGPYHSPERVARSIADAIERGRSELVLSPEGRALSLMRVVAPGLVRFVFKHMSNRLKEDFSHAQA